MQKCVTFFTVNVTYVGFSAYRDNSESISDWARIPYNVVQTDVGGAYDASTGIFTCPVDGFYFFSLSAFSDVRDTAIIASQFTFYFESPYVVLDDFTLYLHGDPKCSVTHKGNVEGVGPD